LASSITTNPAIGNGTIKGRYSIIGKTVIGNISLKHGTTTTNGRGVWYFEFPVPISTNTFWDTSAGSGASHIIGSAFQRNLGTASYWGVVFYSIDTPTKMSTSVGSETTASTQTSSSGPFTMGNGDSLRFNFTYETD
jgi:hypothetical protein